MNRSRNVVLSLFTSVLYQVTLILTNFIVLKLILQNYGSEVNGLNMTIQQIITYLNVVEAGISLTAIKNLYRPLKEKNWKLINSIVSGAKQLYIKSGYLFLILSLIVALILPLVIKSSLSYKNIFYLVLIMTSGSIIEFFLNGKIRVLLSADQKNYIINFIQIVSVLVAFVFKIVLIYFNANIIYIQSGIALAAMIRYYLSIKYVNTKYKKINWSVESNYKNLFLDRWSVLLHQLSGLVTFNAPTILVSIFVGLREASVYSIYNLIYGSLIMIITMFSKSAVPSFGNLLVSESRSGIKLIFNEYMVIFFTFGFWLYSVTSVMILPFIDLFTKNVKDVNYYDTKLVILFGIVGLLNMIRVPHNSIIEASGHYEETKYRALIEAAINFSISLVLVRKIGIYGVLLGGVASFSYRTLDIIFYTNIYIFKRSVSKDLRLICSFFAIFLFSTWLMQSIIQYFIIDTWVKWFFLSSFLSLFSLIIYIVFIKIYSKEFYILIKNRLKKVLLRR